MELEKVKLTEKEKEIEDKLCEKMRILIQEIQQEHGGDASSITMNILAKTVCSYASIIFKKPDDAINYFHKVCLEMNKTIRREIIEE